ncbi:MAG TPA: hypothetical protein VKQ32_04305 [Polyangia bacterium]|nr:hypothetical protein [Polyangia bacterium]
MTARAATPILALALLATATANAAADAGGAAASGANLQGVHLSWVRGDGAGGCPDAAAIEAEVAERLGSNPFARAPTQFIEAIVTQKAEGFQVTIAMRDSGGKLLGSRALTSSPGDCRSIATAAALTTAILIDPDALARAPVPKPPPPATPTPAHGFLPAGRIAALAGAGRGLVPGVAPGGALAATVDLPGPFAVGLTGVLYPEQRTAPPDDGFAFGMTYAELAGCWLPLAQFAPATRARLELCAGAAAGLLHAVVYTATPTAPGQRWTFAPAQLTRFIIPIVDGVVAEVGVEATEPLPRRAFFVAGRPPGMDTVFEQPVVTLAGWGGIGLHWK